MNQLHHKIDLFFEAQLTREEEDSLFGELLNRQGMDPVADEALAVMLASRIPLSEKSREKLSHKKVTVAAASIAAVFAFGIIMHSLNSGHSRAFAYVSGVKTENQQVIKNIISTQLNDIEESSGYFSQTVASDLHDIRDALTVDDQ